MSSGSGTIGSKEISRRLHRVSRASSDAQEPDAEAPREPAERELAANNPIYAPRFQDYILRRAEASFHANPTFSAAAGPVSAAAPDSSRHRGDEGHESSGADWEDESDEMGSALLLSRQGLDLKRGRGPRLGPLRRMSAALAAAMAAGAPRGGRPAAGSPAGSHEPDQAPFHAPDPAAGLPHGSPRGNSSGAAASASTEAGTREAPPRQQSSALQSSNSEGVSPSSRQDAEFEHSVQRIGAWDYPSSGSATRESGDLQFAVTEGLDLEELPRIGSRLPVSESGLPSLKPGTAFRRSSSMLSIDERVAREELSAEAALLSNPASSQSHSSVRETLGEAETGLPHQDAPAPCDAASGRMSHPTATTEESLAAFRRASSASLSKAPDRAAEYSLFARLSEAVAAAQQAGGEPKLVPFVLGYQIPPEDTDRVSDVPSNPAMKRVIPWSAGWHWHAEICFRCVLHR